MAGKYGSYGVTGKTPVPLPTRVIGILAGLSNEGKTTLFAGYEGCLIINCDVSSVSDPIAQVWPVPSEQGYPVDGAGNQVKFNYEAISAIIDRLVEDSVNNKPRPEFVAVDSAKGLTILLKDWADRNQVALGLSRDQVPWNKLNKLAAYGAMWDELDRLIMRLRAAGYGIWFGIHLHKSKVPMGEDATADEYKLLVSDGFYGRVYPMAEVSCVIESQLVPHTITYDEPDQTLKDGRVLAGKKGKTKTENARKWFIGTEPDNVSDKFKGIIKRRIQIEGAVEVPKVGGFAAFMEAWKKAAQIKSE